MKSTTKKGIALAAAAMLTTAAIAPAAIAVTPDDEYQENTNQTGTGSTDLNVRLPKDAIDGPGYGGTDEPENIPNPNFDPSQDPNPETNPETIPNPAYNPDGDGDGYGDNLAFSVPTKINMIAMADGSMEGPDANICYLENHSAFKIHAATLKATKAGNWNVVADATEASDLSNLVDMTIQPGAGTGTAVNIASALGADGLALTAEEWNMAPGADVSGYVADRVEMTTEGHINKVTEDLSADTGVKFATLKWYMKAGENS